MSQSSGQPDRDFQMLLAEHQSVRDDARTTASIFAALASVVILLVAGAAAFLFETNRFTADAWVYAVIPALPVILAAYGVIAGTGVVIRTYYSRAIERELQRHVSSIELEANPSKSGESLPFPSWAHLEIMVGGAPGRSDMLLSALWQIVVVGLELLLLGLVFMLVLRVEPGWLRLVAVVIYTPAYALIIRAGLRNTRRGYNLWTSLVGNLDEAVTRPLWGRSSGSPIRIPVQYLLLPRPNDLIKTLFIPAAVGLAWLSALGTGAPTRSPLDVLWFWLVFELVAYQGRYLLNDIKDRFVDRDHPDEARAARFPIWQTTSPDYALQVAFRSFLLRVAVVIAFWYYLFAKGGDLHFWLLGAASALILYSALYERERDRTTAHPPDNSAGWIPLWLLVGLGYGLRVLIGWTLGAPGASPVQYVLAALGGTALGIAFVTMTWAFEATTIVGKDGTWQASPRFKPHLTVLLRIALDKTTATKPGAVPVPEIAQSATVGLEENTLDPARNSFRIQGLPVTDHSSVLAVPSRTPAPWDWSAVVSMAVFAALGAIASGAGANNQIPLIAAIIALISGWMTTRLSLLGAWASLAVGSIALAAVSVISGNDTQELVTLVAPYLLSGIIYLAFRSFNYADHIQPNFLLSVVALLREIERRLFRVLTRPRGG